jgi:hypothetical protein
MPTARRQSIWSIWPGRLAMAEHEAEAELRRLPLPRGARGGRGGAGGGSVSPATAAEIRALLQEAAARK